jgi:hypothetical protein
MQNAQGKVPGLQHVVESTRFEFAQPRSRCLNLSAMILAVKWERALVDLN